MRAWLVIAGGDREMYPGNDGYQDQPSAFYSWDSTVPRHAEVAVGDRIVVRDKQCLLGHSVIERIDEDQSSKIRYKCPRCGRATMTIRKNVTPRYRCYSCSAEFDERVEQVADITVYRAFYGSAWKNLEGVLSAEELRSMCDAPTSQHSIRTIRWDEFIGAVEGVTEPRDGNPVAARTRSSAMSGLREPTVATDDPMEPVFLGVYGVTPPGRSNLLRERGAACVLLGPAPEECLDACEFHWSMADCVDHGVASGLIRADLRRLLESGRITVDPVHFRIRVADSLKQFDDYISLEGRRLGQPPTGEFQRWLQEHWKLNRPDKR